VSSDGAMSLADRCQMAHIPKRKPDGPAVDCHLGRALAMTLIVAVLVAGQQPMDKFVRYACETLAVSESEIARQLGVTPGCLRAWSRRRAPRYARLALAALIVGLDPDSIASLEQMVASRVNEPT
jgi:hypothetical protein